MRPLIHSGTGSPMIGSSEEVPAEAATTAYRAGDRRLTAALEPGHQNFP
jgi:hypothetical protein